MKGLLNAIVRALKAAASLTGSALDEVGELALMPLKLAQSLFGGGSGGSRLAPKFDPGVSALDVLDRVGKPADDTTAAATLCKPSTITQPDRDGIDTLARYVSALPAARVGYDLSPLSPAVQATIIPMSEAQFAALSKANIGAVRKFIKGEEHGIPGVPVVGQPWSSKTSSAPDAELRHRVRQAFAAHQAGSKPFTMPKMPRQ